VEGPAPVVGPAAAMVAGLARRLLGVPPIMKEVPAPEGGVFIIMAPDPEAPAPHNVPEFV
jgi:hypothetical protein